MQQEKAVQARGRGETSPAMLKEMVDYVSRLIARSALAVLGWSLCGVAMMAGCLVASEPSGLLIGLVISAVMVVVHFGAVRVS